MVTKKCNHCKKTKSVTKFNKDKRYADGYYSWCKSCFAAASKARCDRFKKVGICAQCGKRKAAKTHISCLKCLKKDRVRRKVYHDKTRDEVYQAYGGYRCVCCGEIEPLFLTIDHINNDGARHRKSLPSRYGGLYYWLIKKGFPKGYQVLCMNCNMGKYRNKGICPHKRKSHAKETT